MPKKTPAKRTVQTKKPRVFTLDDLRRLPRSVQHIIRACCSYSTILRRYGDAERADPQTASAVATILFGGGLSAIPLANDEAAPLLEIACRARREDIRKSCIKLADALRRTARRVALDAKPKQWMAGWAASGAKLRRQSRAVILLMANPEWTNVQIAAAVPCSRTTLNRWPLYRDLRAMQRRERQTAAPRGWLESRTGRPEASDSDK